MDLAAGLLRRHVGVGAQGRAGLRRRAVVGGAGRLDDAGFLGRLWRGARRAPGRGAGQHLGQPPVHDLDLAEGADHDVGRLQVAVDHAPAVGEADRLADLRERLQEPRLVGRLQFGGQGLPGDQFHGQEGGAVGQRPQGVDRRDARVRQPGRDLRLADEAVGVGPGQQDLQRDVAVEGEVECGEDPAHAAAGDLAQHAVARASAH